MGLTALTDDERYTSMMQRIGVNAQYEIERDTLTRTYVVKIKFDDGMICENVICGPPDSAAELLRNDALKRRPIFRG